MESKVGMVIMSHLSDVQEEVGMMQLPGMAKQINERVNFVKWLTMKFRNLDMMIDADVEYTNFLNSR